MTINVTITLKCNKVGCSETVEVKGANATRNQLYAESHGKKGWQWKNADTQFCPAHKLVKKEVKAKVAKVAPKSKGVNPSPKPTATRSAKPVTVAVNTAVTAVPPVTETSTAGWGDDLK